MLKVYFRKRFWIVVEFFVVDGVVVVLGVVVFVDRNYLSFVVVLIVVIWGVVVELVWGVTVGIVVLWKWFEL